MLKIKKLVRFQMTRCEDGYVLRDGKIFPASERSETDGLQENAFLRFANVPVYRKRFEGEIRPHAGGVEMMGAEIRSLNAAGMVEFAGEHGLLGDGNAAEGDSLNTWRDAISAMREALDALATANWNGATLGPMPSARQLENFSDQQERLLRHDEPPGEPLTPSEAQQQLRAMLNRHLAGAKLQVEIHSGCFSWHIRPDSLLTALWAQLLESLSTDHTIRQCEGCGTWMEIQPWGKDSKRFNRRTCSDACRVDNNKKFVRRAEQLASEGKVAGEIVETLRREGWRPAAQTNPKTRRRSPIETVRDWIGPVSKTGRAAKRLLRQ